MKVSVIITTIGRNSLKDAIKSVEEQTYKDKELIIINDYNRNLGGAKALNKGLKQAKGEYVAILDDDDLWISKDKLERQVDFLDKHKNYIAVGSGKQKGQGEEIKVNLKGTPFIHISIMFRKWLMYDENLDRAKDLDLMIRLSKMGKLGVIDNCEVWFRESDIDKKIKDCYWHRKVILKHRKDFSLWFINYIGSYLREVKLICLKVFLELQKGTGKIVI